MGLEIIIKTYTQALHIDVTNPSSGTERKEAYIDINDIRSVCRANFDPNCVQLVFTDGSQKNLNHNDIKEIDTDTNITSQTILFDKLVAWRFPNLT